MARDYERMAVARNNRELARLLRTGPFDAALDAAIAASGLSLGALCERLTTDGVSVSRTALSYWRHGRSRPERSESLKAVAGLEEILGLPSSALLSLLGTRRPQAAGSGTPRVRSTGGSCGRRQPLLAAMHAPPDGQLAFLSVSDLLVVDEDSDVGVNASGWSPRR